MPKWLEDMLAEITIDRVIIIGLFALIIGGGYHVIFQASITVKAVVGVVIVAIFYVYYSYKNGSL